MASKGSFNLDFSKIGDTIDLDQVPAVIEKIQVRIGATTGNPYMNWEFSVLHPEYMGRKVWMTTGMTPEGLWSTKLAFATLGFDVSGAIDLQVNDTTDDVEFPNFKGCVVVLNLDEDEWPVGSGNMRTRVTSIAELRKASGDASLLGGSDEDEDEDTPLGEEDEEEDEEEDTEDSTLEDMDEDEEEEEVDPASLIKSASKTVRDRNAQAGVTPPPARKANSGTKTQAPAAGKSKRKALDLT